MWPLNISVLPPPAPRHVPSTLGRPSSTSCHCTCSPMSWNRPAMCSAIACSDPVGLGMSTMALAVSTRLRRSTWRPELRFICMAA